MVDWEKQKKFQKLGAVLGRVLGQEFGCEFSFEQQYIANRFELHSKRPASLYYMIEFTNEEILAVAVSDGEHVPAFTGIVAVSHCIVMYDDGWMFDHEAIAAAARRLMELGRTFYIEHEQGRGERARKAGSLNDALKDCE